MRSSTPTSALPLTLLLSLALIPLACSDRNVDLPDGGATIEGGSGDGPPRPLDRGLFDTGAPDRGARDRGLADSRALGSDAGADALIVTDNDSCSHAQRVALSGGKLALTGDTSNAANQFGTAISCDTSTSFDGPQRYYVVALSAGKSYRATLTPQGFDAGLYAFAASTGCNAQAIDLACRGYASDAVGSSAVETITITPVVDQDWVLVVDAYAASEQGAFSLQLEQFVPPKNARCASPETLTLVSGKVSVSGATTLAQNEFGKGIACDTSYDFDGAQVYYKVALSAGKHYQLTATSSAFDTALYAFAASTGCSVTAINTACAGHVSDLAAGKPDRLTISPTVAGEWIVVVDSDWDDESGPFTLEIAEVILPKNGSCAQAETLPLVAGKAVVSADTSQAGTDEFGSAVTCGKSYGFDAAQLYYKVPLQGGKTYRVTLDPNSFDGVLYAFAASTGCSATAVNLGCNGNISDAIGSGTPESLLLSPVVDADWIVVVDGYVASDAGTFTLKLEEIVTPTNSSCSKAQAVALTAGQLTFTGDTSLSKNEFGNAVSCGSSYDFDAPQLYYRVSLSAGKTYKVGMTSTGFDGALYAFAASAGCTAPAIDAACSGTVSEQVSAGKTEVITVAPAVDGDWIVVVDGYTSSEAGPFELTILQTP